MTVASTLAVTVLVVTSKLVDEDPPAMVTEAGTVASLLLERRLRVTPPGGAWPVKLTVPTT